MLVKGIVNINVDTEVDPLDVVKKLFDDVFTNNDYIDFIDNKFVYIYKPPWGARYVVDKDEDSKLKYIESLNNVINYLRRDNEDTTI